MLGIVCSSRARQLLGLFSMHTAAVMRQIRNSVARLGTRYQLFFGSDPLDGDKLGIESDFAAEAVSVIPSDIPSYSEQKRPWRHRPAHGSRCTPASATLENRRSCIAGSSSWSSERHRPRSTPSSHP